MDDDEDATRSEGVAAAFRLPVDEPRGASLASFTHE